MLGFRLFRHAVLMLVDNVVPAVRVSVVPFAGAVAIALLFAFAGGTAGTPGGVLLALVPASLIGFFVICWIAVGWHRFVLAEEEPGPAWPSSDTGYVRSYALAMFRMIPLTVLLTLLVTLAFVLIGLVFGQQGVSTEDGTFLGFLLSIAISYVTLRLGLVLPAAAVGTWMRVPEAWQITGPYSGAILVLAICIGIFGAIPNLIVYTPLAPILAGFSYFLLASWLLIMLSISSLTALYGHIVEGRPLR